MLKLEDLKNMKGGEFQSGTIFDPRISKIYKIKWVAVRGEYHDWTIYYEKSYESNGFIMTQGCKLTNGEVIRELVCCDDDSFAMYRF